MRLEITAGEIKEQEAVIVVVDGVIEESEPFLQDHVCLSQEFVIDEHVVLARVVVFLEAGRGEEPETLRHVLDE